MQIAVGLRRLGHQVDYLETTPAWPYDPVAESVTAATRYPVEYLARTTEVFGLGERWAHRRSYGDGRWEGPRSGVAESLLREADLVVSISGATSLAESGLAARRVLYLGTDPVKDEVAVAGGGDDGRWVLDNHTDFATYGENIGTDRCPLPALPGAVATRQPILLDFWETDRLPREVFTTVGNWKQTGNDVEWCGETYAWSKHHEFLRHMAVPDRARQPVELATGLSQIDPQTNWLLEQHGWVVVDGQRMSMNPLAYRDYIINSRAEFTVAKDQNVRLRTGWFSERSACYLAAGRPVVTQDTGFSDVLPTGEGLFGFTTTDEAVDAVAQVNADYRRHSRAARSIAEDHFRAETVLSRLLKDIGA
jgi:hypothetical protein